MNQTRTFRLQEIQANLENAFDGTFVLEDWAGEDASEFLLISLGAEECVMTLPDLDSPRTHALLRAMQSDNWNECKTWVMHEESESLYPVESGGRLGRCVAIGLCALPQIMEAA